jgi:hypothetical protein
VYPGAPRSPFRETPTFYAANAGATPPIDIGGMLQALMQHEGWGKPGVHHSGHTSAMKEAIMVRDRLFDPRKSIEPYSAPDRKRLVRHLDGTLELSQHWVDIQSADPLAEIWSGDINAWSLADQAYQRVSADIH